MKPIFLGSVSHTISVLGDIDDGNLADNLATFTINVQEACHFLLDRGNSEFAVAGGAGSISIITTSACMWTATSDESWIRLDSALRYGPGQLSLTVDSNTNALRRIGIIRVAGLIHTIYQAGVRQAGSPLLAPFTDGVINTIDHCGNQTFIGGKFAKAGNHTGSVVIFDSLTGDMLPGFPIVNGPVNVAIPDQEGGWYIGGMFTEVGGYRRSRIARIRSDLSVDSQFAPGINVSYSYRFEHRTGIGEPSSPSDVRALLLTDGILYIGGNFKEINGLNRWGLASVNADDGTVTDFNPFFDYERADVAPDGFVFKTSEAPGIIQALEIESGLLYCGGVFTGANKQFNGGTSSPRRLLACVNATSGVVTRWSPNLSGRPGNPNGLKVWNDSVVVSGDYGIVQIDRESGSQLPWNPAQYGSYPVTAFAIQNDFLIAAFEGTAPNPPLVRINLINGVIEPWAPPVGEDPDGFTRGTIAGIYIEGETLLCAGNFNHVGPLHERPALCRLDLLSGAVDAFKLTTPFSRDLMLGNRTLQSVRSFSVSSNRYLLAGNFISYNAVDRHNLAAFDATSGLILPSWNSTVWRFFNGESFGQVFDLKATSNTLFVAGDFTHAGVGFPFPWDVPESHPRTNLAAFHFRTGAVLDWNPNVNAPVHSLAQSGQTIFAGGAFSKVNQTTPRNFLAAFDGLTGEVLPWNPNVNNIVKAVATDGESVFAGGHFTVVNGGLSRRGLAAFSLITGEATSFNPNVSVNSLIGVQCLLIHGSLIYAGGEFSGNSSVNGFLRRDFVGAFDSKIGAATEWAPSPNGPVYALTSVHDEIWLSGLFTTVNTTTASQQRRLFASFNELTGIASALNGLNSWTHFRDGSVRAMHTISNYMILGGTSAGFSYSFLTNNPAYFDYGGDHVFQGSGALAVQIGEHYSDLKKD